MPSVSDLTTIRRFLDTLSWKKIAQLAAFLFVIVFGWLTFEMRESIYNFAVQSRIQKNHPSNVLTKLSKKSITEIDNIVSQSQLIVGISVVNVDFQKNLRTIVYVSIDDPKFKEEYTSAYGATTTLPLFNTDVLNNKRLVGIINGEFICNNYADTIQAQTAPGTKKYVSSVCISGIPPYYGAFSGIVNIYLNRQPTSEEVDQIRVISRNISVLVYDSDFK
jgi:predicted lactoylglutathione lyase